MAADATLPDEAFLDPTQDTTIDDGIDEECWGTLQLETGTVLMTFSKRE